MGSGAERLVQLAEPRRARCAPEAVPLAILAAHPDDETIGAASLLLRVPGAVVIHVTDGAPCDSRFWPEGLRLSREGYAAHRRDELVRALSVAGVGPGRLHALGASDQEAVGDLVPLARALAGLLAELRPLRLVTHAYEGGHPDHDAAAFLARAAQSLLVRGGLPPPRLLEMAAYHGGAGELRTFTFLEGAGRGRPRTRRLAPVERRLKAEMLGCFGSQAGVLRWFPVELERWRLAPGYDFGRPPHDGPLWYERMGFALAPERWRRLAADAARALAREEPRA